MDWTKLTQELWNRTRTHTEIIEYPEYEKILKKQTKNKEVMEVLNEENKAISQFVYFSLHHFIEGYINNVDVYDAHNILVTPERYKEHWLDDEYKLIVEHDCLKTFRHKDYSDEYRLILPLSLVFNEIERTKFYEDKKAIQEKNAETAKNQEAIKEKNERELLAKLKAKYEVVE